ncbi:MAG TPA: hypothetical protein VLT62_31060 [Candidatus Methylomirabilis sp.]|nr:hypothetical protein [Candidatus Methylomirabilis sp.]
MRTLGLVLVLGLLSGCASSGADPRLDAEAKLFRAPIDKAWIYIAPTPSLTEAVVRLDGRKVGTLGHEYYLRLEVAPGRHALSATPDSLIPAMVRGKRDDVTLETEAGQCYFFRTVWMDDASGWGQRRVTLDRLSEAEGQRAVNVLWLMRPTK